MRGGAQPGRATADHHDVPGPDRDGGHRQHALRAAHRQPGADAGGALVAAGARPHRVAAQGLRGEVGVGELAADHADQVAVRQRRLGLGGRGHPADADDRQARRPQPGGQRQRVPVRTGHRGLDQVQRGGGDAGGGGQPVHGAGRGEAVRGGDGVLRRRPPGLGGGQPDAEQQVRTQRLPDGGHHLEQQPGAVGAVAVGAPVGRGVEEGAQQGGLGGLQLHAVQPAVPDVPGDPGEPGDDGGQVGRRRPAGHLAEQRVGDRRGREQRDAGVQRAALAAVVVELGDDERAVGVHRVGDVAVPVDDGGVGAVDDLLVGLVGRVDRLLLGDHQCGTTAAGRAA